MNRLAYIVKILSGIPLVLVLSTGLNAQDNAGKIKEIKDTSKQPHSNIHGSTERVQVQRGSAGRWWDAQEGSLVGAGTRVRVLQQTYAWVQLNSRNQKGDVVVSPIGPDSSQTEAIYEINENIDQIEGVELLLVKGTMVVNWLHGKLQVIAAEIPVLFIGTRVVFVVGDNGRQGYMFLREGVIKFPRHPGTTIYPGQIAKLVTGQAPQVLRPGAARVEQLNRFTEYNIKTLWHRPRSFWKKPRFYVPATAAVIGGGILIAVSGNDDNFISGTVTVGIP